MPTRALTICPRCTTKHPVGKRCPLCSARRGTTIERGYDAGHVAKRAAIQRALDEGQYVQCWRCQQQITPDQPFDLGHDDTDRRRYRGPEHVACNCGAANTGRQ